MSKPFEKHVKDRPYAKPEAAAARLLEIAKTLRIDEGRMPIGEWNSTFIWKDKASVAEYTAWPRQAHSRRHYQNARVRRVLHVEGPNARR